MEIQVIDILLLKASLRSGRPVLCALFLCFPFLSFGYVSGNQETAEQLQRPRTYITLEGFLSGVGPHVFIQTSLLTEGLVTLTAFIWLLLQGHTDKYTLYRQITSQHTANLYTMGRQQVAYGPKPSRKCGFL